MYFTPNPAVSSQPIMGSTPPMYPGQPCYVLVMPQGQATPMAQPFAVYDANAPVMVSIAMPTQGVTAAPAPPPPPPAYNSVFLPPPQAPHGSILPPPPALSDQSTDVLDPHACSRDDNPTNLHLSSGAATVDPACEAMIADLRKEKTDRSIRSRVLRLPISLCVGMTHYLASSEELMSDLCMHERGIIVAHLVERLGAEGSVPILHFATRNFMTLALNQSGCIALPRIMSNVNGQPLQTFFELTMSNLHALIDHPYGNYIVKHFAGLKEASFNLRLMNDYFANHFVRIATNKFGSHVLEDVLRALSAEELYPYARNVFSDVGALRALTNDRFANYCVQTMFRVLAGGDPRFHSWCVGQVIGAVRGSPYEQNIMKSAMAGYRGGQPPPPPPQPQSYSS